MSYQPLARKYRPQRFEDLVGQQSVVLSLSNAIRLGRVVPCLIFAGVRGIGKTTVARLYAKALNCENGPTHEPCNKCESCIAIAGGFHEDVIEIDGASNNGVDDVRLLQETLGYVPQRSKYKVYIIDEVHMLTTNAFNALLKTLEEPPPHIIFIFATTELRQLPDTILGRCQVYHLRKLSLDQISERLQTILRVEGIEYDQPAVDLVCREGQGSMRDAITFLDQLIALGGGRLDYKKICEMIAYVPSSMCLEFVRYLLALDITSVLDLISQWDQRGVALTVVLDDIIRNVRDVSIVKEMDGKTAHPGLLGTESQGINTLQRIAETVSAYDLHALFRALVDCRSQLNGSSIDRYIVENYVMEWTLAKKDERFRIKDKASSISRDFETLGSDQIKVADNMQTSLASDGRQTLTIEENNVNAAARLVEQSSDTPSTSTTFPESWRILVEKWKRKKPVQGRMLEEAIPVEYSTAKIVLAVNPSGLAGKDLLNPDTQREIAEQFKIHFDFKGVLNIYPKESSGRENAGGITSTDDTESLLEIKKKEKEQFNQKTLEEATHHQVTQKALRQFKGKIESIEIKQDDN